MLLGTKPRRYKAIVISRGSDFLVILLVDELSEYAIVLVLVVMFIHILKSFGVFH